MDTMKAIRMSQYGGREVLTFEDAPTPQITQDEVLVKVAATSVNPFDWAARSGYLAEYYAYTFPHILGLDVSGVVEAVGSNVKGFSVGDAVYARSDPSKNGAYAAYIALPASAIAKKPRSLDFTQAAAVPHAAFSAWEALFNVAHLAAGQTVLIHAAAGGVGSFAVQFAKNIGARVIGTCSSVNVDFVRSLGADEVIDYTATRFEDVVHDVDVVLDLVGDMGDATQQRSWGVLKPGGILVSLVQFPSPQTAAEHGVRSGFATAVGIDGQFLSQIAAMIDAGKVLPVVSHTYPLSDIQGAHAHSESRHLRGKIVVKVDD